MKLGSTGAHRPARSRLVSFRVGNRLARTGRRRETFPIETYVVCTNPRSGSWLLSEGLGGTTLAGYPREWFNIQEEQQQRARWRLDHKSDLNLTAYLRLIRSKSTTGNGISGVKLYTSNTNWSIFPEGSACLELTPSQVLMQLFPEARYIWLRRRDKVRQAISLSIASSTNEWWSIAAISIEKSEGTTQGPTFDPQAIARLERALQRNDANWQDFFQQNNITPLVIDYEDLASDYPATVKAVLKWLGVENADSLNITPPRLQRQADERSEEWVTRYNAFKDERDIVAERDDEGDDPLRVRARRNQENIAGTWKQWVAQSMLNRMSDDAIVTVLVDNGYSRETALAEVKRAASDPYFIGCARLQRPLVRASSLLHIQDQLARLHSQARTVKRRTDLSRADFRDEYYAADRPVIIESLMTKWPAMTAWTSDNLKSAAGDRIVDVMIARDADKRYQANARRHRTEVGFAAVRGHGLQR